MARPMEIVTPFAKDDLLFTGMTASESLGRMPEYNIAAISTKNDLDPDKILGKRVTVKLQLPKGDPRCFDAYVTRFGLAGYQERFYRYQIVAKPWLWFLTRTTDCKIFQNKTVPQIVKEVLDSCALHAYEDKLTGKYTAWEYCVQYRETDFNFISRLMEQEGIYYYFKHESGKHTMVLCDASSVHKCYPAYETVPYLATRHGSTIEQEYLTDWLFYKEVQPGTYAMRDFNFEKPSVDLSVQSKEKRAHAEAGYEYYDYPGEYVTSAEGDHYVKVRLEEWQAQHHVAQGSTNARGLAVGHSFELTGQPRGDQNCSYLVCSATHELSQTDYESAGGSGANYQCLLSALPSKVAFRPQRITPKPIVQGPQTAIVVGPAGDEIYVDKYGRVKVQFHWDRYGKKDENSSCWVRVAHHWAGKNWGMIAHPRIGQEVIVEFLEGDPDQPIITGRVYNAEQMPPYDLPANATQSGIKSRSSKTGSPANFNEIRFEDKKGAEQVYIHAEKNQDNIVENDETTDVGHDRTEKVGNNETITIGVNRLEKVGVDETVSVGSNRSVTVGASETKKVALQRTHLVGVNETIGVGGAQEIGIGGMQAIVVGAFQTTNVVGYQMNTIGAAQTNTIAAAQTNTIGAAQTNTIGAAQSNNITAAQSTTVGAARSIKVGAAQDVSVASNASMKIGGDESRAVTGSRSTTVGSGDTLKVTGAVMINATDSITLKTGSASITMNSNGSIIIKGSDITVDGSGKITIKAGGEIKMTGSKILQN